MTRFAKFSAAALGITLLAGTAFADGHVNAAVKARQSQMTLYAFNIGQLGAMAKGAVDYDAAKASAAAANLAALTALDQSALWPQGSDSDSFMDSNAKPEMWQNFPDVMTKGKSLADAAMFIQTAAGGGLDSLRGTIGPLGGACSACHKAYRVPQN